MLFLSNTSLLTVSSTELEAHSELFRYSKRELQTPGFDVSTISEPYIDFYDNLNDLLGAGSAESLDSQASTRALFSVTPERAPAILEDSRVSSTGTEAQDKAVRASEACLKSLLRFFVARQPPFSVRDRRFKLQVK